MNPLKIIGKVIAIIPAVIDAVRGQRGKRELDAPLGESEAARAIRLEEERRRQAADDAMRRGK